MANIHLLSNMNTPCPFSQDGRCFDNIVACMPQQGCFCFVHMLTVYSTVQCSTRVLLCGTAK